MRTLSPFESIFESNRSSSKAWSSAFCGRAARRACCNSESSRGALARRFGQLLIESFFRAKNFENIFCHPSFDLLDRRCERHAERRQFVFNTRWNFAEVMPLDQTEAF